MDTKGIKSAPLIGEPLTKGSEKTSHADAAKKRLADAKAKDSAKSAKDYGVNVSQQARDMVEARHKAKLIASQTNPVREDRVAELRKRIQSGDYKADPAKIADGILQEAIRDQVALDMHDKQKR